MRYIKAMAWFLGLIFSSFGVKSTFYFIAMWLFLTIAASLFFMDIYRGAGVIAAYIIYQIIRNYYEAEILEQNKRVYQEEMRKAYAESDEEKGV